MDHRDIWQGIDALAALHNLSTSGLARRAGLDPTSFNRSKRMGRDGRLRWPSTESLARVLHSVNTGFEDFARLATGKAARTVPLLGLAQAGADGFFDAAGFPINQGWEDVDFPGDALEEGLYALEISGDSMLPAYRPGDRIIVSPMRRIRAGDRIVAKTTDGEVMAKILARDAGDRIELQSINDAHPPRHFAVADIAWMARILWVSQ